MGGYEAWRTMWSMYSPIVEGSRSGMKGAIWNFAKTSANPKQLLERIVKLDATVSRFQRERLAERSKMKTSRISW